MRDDPSAHAEAAALSVYAEGMLWGEGPRCHDGALWLSDTQGSRLWTDASGTWTPAELESPCNGLWFLPDGRLVGAMIREKQIGVWNGQRFDTYADLADADGPLGDMTGDDAGNLYVDDVGYGHGEEPRPGRLLRVAPDGTMTVAAADINFPNGLALIDGGRTLVVAETWAQRLLAFSVAPDGTLGDRRIYTDIAETVGAEARPDGLWPAPGGGVFVACLMGQQVAHVEENTLIRSFDTGIRLPVACCINDRSQLLVTAADTRGRPLMEAVAARDLDTIVVAFDL